MVERLKGFLEVLETEKVDIENADIEEIVAVKVADYEKQVRTQLLELREKRIADKEVEINVFKRYIEAEEKRIEDEAYQQFLRQKEIETNNSVANTETEEEYVVSEFEDVSVENL